MDTISMRIIGKDKYTIAPYAPFVPEFSVRKFSDLSSGERNRNNGRIPYLRHFVLHAESTDGLRLPQVEIFEVADWETLSVVYEMKITTSLPNLVFENNLEEFDFADPELKKQVTGTLSERLAGVGIGVRPWNISLAPLSVLHIAKNIPLHSSIKMRRLLTTLSKTDAGKAFDVTDGSDFARMKNRNDGRVVNIRSGTREWAFYDKIEDSLRPKSKRFDKSKNERAKELIGLHDLENTEVFRFEYRLNKAQTIRSEVNKILKREYQTPVTFGDIFSKELCKTILLNAWKTLINRPENQPVLFAGDNRLELLLHILTKAHDRDKSAHSQNLALWSYGLATVIMDHGAKTLKHEMGKVWSSKAGERLEEKIATAVALAKEIPLSDDIMFISNALRKFERYVPGETPKDHEE